MSSIFTIARIYASAVFDVSMQQKSTEQWRLVLQWFAKVSSYDLVRTLFARSLDPERMSNIFIAICEDVQKNKIDILPRNLIHIMSEKNRLSLLPIVFEEFNYLYFIYYKCIITVEVLSVYPLSIEQNNKIIVIMQRFFSSKKINIVNKIDKNIYAGIIIRVRDTIIDGSLFGRMARLKNHILQS